MPRPGSSPVHPSYATSLHALGGFLDERSVTIEERAAGRDSFGQPNGGWTAVDGLEDLACTVGRAQGRESDRSTDTLTVATHTIALAGYVPEITTAMRAVVDGTEIHDIEAVHHDSRLTVTQLMTKVVS